MTCHCELIDLANSTDLVSSNHSLTSTVACLGSELAVAMAPHGAPGALKVSTGLHSTGLQSEAESEKRVKQPHTVMGNLKAPNGEGTDKVRRFYKAPGAYRAQCSDSTPKYQVGRTDKKAPPVFRRSQIFLIVLCLLFNHCHAGRILMYLPVATR